MFFLVFISFLILQRLVELLIARRNEKISKRKGGIEYDAGGYKYIVLMHIFFFISLIIEYTFFSSGINSFSIFLLVIFIAAQIVRYWAIVSLGVNWNTKIIVVPGTANIENGPYKYICHPNYIAVITEIAVIPLIFSCYFTSIIFTLINLILLKRRIRIEEHTLNYLN
jgi:methyltransferase